MEHKGLLSGMKVLDLSRVLAAPYCGMMLADLGAEVIKIERPGKGDDARSNFPIVNGESAYYMNLNRNKRGIVLNLKSQAGKEVFRKLVAQSDVVAAMAGGHLDASFTQMQPAKSQVEAGTLKMLGFLADQRMESYPDIPTVSETMNTDTNFRGWVVVCAPAGTDQAKIDYLSDIFAKAVASDEYKAAIRNLGMEPVELTGTALNDMLKADDAKYAELCTGITLN